MAEFCHLHCHTQYSLLDGAAQIQGLIDRSVELEMPALAITDHGNLFGVPEFFTKAKKARIRPIIGCEFYVTASPMADRTDRKRYHQVLLAKNEEGYQNLIQLSSLSYTNGFYYKPRIDRAALAAHSGGLIASTCCLQGEVPQAILREGEEAARSLFETYLDMFGDDYFIEIQDHGIDDQLKVNEVLLRFAKDYGVKLLATNDVHYVDREDHAAQDVLLCLQTGKDYADPNRMRFENDQFYLKSPFDMEASLGRLEPAQRQEALASSIEIADRCTFDLPMGQLLMPHFPLPDAFADDAEGYLRHLVMKGARWRYGEVPLVAQERIDFELGVIRDMGYTGYFLIVQDFTTAARSLGVHVGPGRGSAAGSLAAYCLGITNIDPLKYELLFERFLNPERVSMPDIDIDFDDRGRSRVIDYVVEKYGRENVCQIITFGTMGARSSIRDVARVLGVPLSDADRIAKLVPEGVKVSLDTAIEEVAEFRALLEDPNEQIRNLLHYARVLEGSARHTGVHAAGVIIAPGRVSDFIPIAVAKSKGDDEPVMITQYDGKWVESFGLLKMDFLGLKTLTVLDDTLRLVKENHGVELDLDSFPLTDPGAFELFQKGDTVAIFQFESSGMREWLRKLRPTSIDDLIAMNALYRPGPMELIPNYIARKHGEEEVSYPHPMLEPVLEATYGIPVYQEQVMQMAQVMGGYSLGNADILRRAMGKKKKKEMDLQREIFVQGAIEREVDEKIAREVFDMMAKFAGYGFNKSHSAAYSIVAYQTAWLKANYPAEFLAAAMTNEMGDTKKLAIVLEDARHFAVEVLPPSINESEAHFTVDDGKIRFGLGAIKGLGLGAIELIVEARAKADRFKSLFDLLLAVDARTVNRKAVESLIRAGALDELKGHRAQLLESLDTAIQYAHRVQADRAAGQNSLFGKPGGDGAAVMVPHLSVVDPWPRARTLKEEREVVGFYVSGHPLEAYTPEARAFASASIVEVEKIVADHEPVDDGRGYGSRPTHTLCGIITDVVHRRSKSGKPMAFATIEDYTGQAEVLCFSNTYDRSQGYLEVDEVVLVRGGLEMRGGSAKIIADEITPMWKAREQMVRSIVLEVDLDDMDEATVEKLLELCDQNRGTAKLYFDVFSPRDRAIQRILSRTVVVEPNNDVMLGIAKLFGRERIRVEGEAG